MPCTGTCRPAWPRTAARRGWPRTANASWRMPPATTANVGRTWPCAARSSSTSMASAACCGCCAGARPRPAPATARAAGSWTMNSRLPSPASRWTAGCASMPCWMASPRPRATCARRCGTPSSPRSPTRRKPHRYAATIATRSSCGPCRRRWQRPRRSSGCRKACWPRVACWKACRTATAGPGRCPAGAGPCWSLGCRPCWEASWQRPMASV